MNIHKLCVNAHGRTFVQEAPGQDIQTQFGIISGADIDTAQDGDVILSATGEKLIVYSPQFIDAYKRIKRDAQIITFKDAGVILATAGLGPDSVVAEAGAGSGAMTCMLARHCKHVYTYDISEHNLSVAQENTELLGLDNVTFTQHDITHGLPDGPVDALMLDMPEPWKVLDKLDNLVIGGYIITYTPSATQMQQVMNTAREVGLMHVRTVELTERHWMAKGEAVRPTSRNTAFTAFICFFRNMGPHFTDIQPKQRPKSTGEQLPDEDVMEAVFE